MIDKLQLESALALQVAKTAKNEKRVNFRAIHGDYVTFSFSPYGGKNGDLTSRDVSPEIQFSKNVASYVANRILRSINKSKSFDKSENSLDTSKRILQRHKERNASKGKIAAFSENDMEEIFSICSLFLSAGNCFHAMPFNGNLHRDFLTVITNFVKGIHGLQLNRFHKGKHASLDEMQGMKGDSMEENFSDDDEFFNPSNEEKTGKDFHADHAFDCDEIGESNEDFDSLQEKTNAIFSLIDFHHDASNSRKREQARKSDKQFFRDCLNHCATGNGKETPEQFRTKKSRFIATLKSGFSVMREFSKNSSTDEKFNEKFNSLAHFFNA